VAIASVGEQSIRNPIGLEEEDMPIQNKVDVVGPLALWLAVLVFGLALELLSMLMPTGAYAEILIRIGNYLLYLPSSIVLPLIVGLWLGHRVGLNARSITDAPKEGLLNAVYVSFVYAVAIFVIYFLLTYIEPHFADTLSSISFLEQAVGLPVAIVLVLTTLMGVLSAARSK